MHVYNLDKIIFHVGKIKALKLDATSIRCSFVIIVKLRSIYKFLSLKKLF